MNVRTIGVVVGACTTAACARGPVDLTPSLDALTTEWLPFRWVDAAVGETNVAGISLLVRWPEASGDTTDLQLDFGLAGQGRFGFPIRTLVVDSGGASSARTAGRVRRLGNRDDSTGSGGFRVGTLGLLAFYFGPSTVVVDPVGQRIGRIHSSDSLPSIIGDRLEWVSVREVEGRLFLPLEVDGRTRGEVLIDPASGIVPVLLDAALWREVTQGRPVAEPATRRVFPTVDGELVVEGAVAGRPVVIGGFRRDTDTVYRVVSAPPSERMVAEFEGSLGVVGAQFLAWGRLLVIDLGRKRLAWYP